MPQDHRLVADVAARPASTTFDPATLAVDLHVVQRTYARLFETMDTARWDVSIQRGRNQWALHETIAHLCALNGAGLESIKHTLRGEPCVFRGLESRYLFDSYNRAGIDAHRGMAPNALCAEFLRIHQEAEEIAAGLRPDQAQITAQMPVYNRPVQIVEALSIMMMHASLIHAAQVAEPAGVAPLWTQLSPEVHHRVIGRVMRASSLLYRRDIGGSLRASIGYRIGGAGGGEWHVHLSPDAPASSEGAAESPTLVLHFRDTSDFFRLVTGRVNLPLALIGRRLKLHGDLRLFLRMKKLFSVDARP